ncbi:MAG: SBBP repeat-containing protein [Bacteroidota bacterium]
MKKSNKLNTYFVAAAFLVMTASNQICKAQEIKDSNKLIPTRGFTKNAGQVLNTNGESSGNPLYYSTSGNMSYYLLQDKISYVFSKHQEASRDSFYRMDLTFVKNNGQVSVKENNKLYDKNFYLTQTGERGLSNVGVFESIDYAGLPSTGISLNCSMTNGLQFAFNLDKHIAPDALKFYFEGATTASVNKNGVLTVTSPAGAIAYNAPSAYQVISGSPCAVTIGFNVANNKISFTIGNYNPDFALTILLAQVNPVIYSGSTASQYWSTYIEGSLADENHDVWVDKDNNVYCAGETYSNAFFFPASGGQFTSHPGYFDAYVLKFNAERELQWGSYFGGSQGSDIGLQVAVNSSGFVYLAGETYSNNIPVCKTCGADPLYLRDTILNGGMDIFIAKFDSHGQMSPSTNGTFASYFGGGSFERLMSMTIDNLDNVYLSGWVSTYGSSDFPLVSLPGAYNQPFGQSNDHSDGFIAKISPSNNILWSTAIGGNSNNYQPEMISDLTVDKNNNLYATGRSSAIGNPNYVAIAPCTSYTPNYFPMVKTGTSNAYVKNNNGGMDAIIMKFSSQDAIVWSTFFGGQGDENVHLENSVGTYLNSGIAVNSSGNIFITGSTNSSVYEDDSLAGTPSDFPHHKLSVSGNYNQAAYGGGDMDAFIAMFNPGNAILWSTFYGDSNTDAGTGTAANSNGEVYFTGLTNSPAFPVKSVTGFYNQNQVINTQDAYISQFNNVGTYEYGSFYGGNGIDAPKGIATEPNGCNVVFCGGTSSSDFPMADNTPGGTAFMDPGAGNFIGDAFIVNFTNQCIPDIKTRVEEINNNNEDGQMIVYPNPASQYITPAVTNAGELSDAVIYNSTGTAVKSFNKINAALYTGDLTSGMYVIKARSSSGQIKTAKFIIQKGR